MQLQDDQRVRLRDNVLSRVLDGETVLLDLKSGTYFGLNEIGSEVWDLLAKGRTVTEILDRLLQLYDVDRATARADLEQLLGELLQRDLVTVEE